MYNTDHLTVKLTTRCLNVQTLDVQLLAYSVSFDELIFDRMQDEAQGKSTSREICHLGNERTVNCDASS
jgi:hypothetical protein